MLCSERHLFDRSFIKKRNGCSGCGNHGPLRAVFAALTMHLRWQVRLVILTLPFNVFLIIGAAAIHPIGLVDTGVIQLKADIEIGASWCK